MQWRIRRRKNETLRRAWLLQRVRRLLALLGLSTWISRAGTQTLFRTPSLLLQLDLCFSKKEMKTTETAYDSTQKWPNLIYPFSFFRLTTMMMIPNRMRHSIRTLSGAC
jgi:hypothetical protein